MDLAAETSLPSMFFAQAAALGDRPFLWRREAAGWVGRSWREVAVAANRCARGLLAAGLAEGDRVILVSENRPEWPIADIGIMSAGGVTVPGYTTNTVADHLHLINNSGARYAIVSQPALAERVIAAAARADHPPRVITIEPPGLRQNPGIELSGWSELLAAGDGRPDDIAERILRLGRRSLACVIYTSGTGGVPRGVMHSHGGIMSNCAGAHEVLKTLGPMDDEVFLSFLPLSHAYEHTAGQFFPISLGAQIYYVESTDQLIGTIPEVRPTLMLAVPRLYEVLRPRILRAVERQGGLAEMLFKRALALGSRRYERPEAMTPIERLEDRALDLLVRRKIARRFGGRLKAFVSGGAPLNYEVGLFFTALGVRLLQGYGQTENSPVASVMDPRKPRLRTVGPPIPGVAVRIAEDGEILLSGEAIMLGYWNDPEGTAEAVRDGWLHTGDVGRIDEDGFIVITDRKRDIIVNSGGDNISPQRVEGFLTLEPEISQAMVYGDRRPYLVAAIVPSAEFAAAWAGLHGRTGEGLAALVGDPGFRADMAAALERVNRSLSSLERVRKFLLIGEPFTVDNGMSTPTLKLRRHEILARYGEGLRALYEGDG